MRALINPTVKIYLLPGGVIPKRQTEGAVGYDGHARAIVSPVEMDKDNSNLRKTIFDFKNLPEDPVIGSHVLKLPKKNGQGDELVYRMEPGESVLIGLGFITEMPPGIFYWVAPRSGLASKYNITVTNAPGTVDPDYRGEAGVLIYNRASTRFDLKYGMRIAQIVFQEAIIPEFLKMDNPLSLFLTNRGAGGFGSTGLR